ncbi:amino acid permease [candidate division KSB1 bacterium]|nr:amino acid permease [candidate division KSB1 bacterium]
MFSEETELNRRLGLTEAFSIVVGRIIGSGIFRTPYSIMLKVTAVSMYFGVWIVGGIATFLGAFCYAELAAMMPRSGGPYAYIKAAYGPVWTFLRGWAMFFVSETGAIAVVALVFAESANEFYEIAVGQRFGHGLEVIIALDIIWMLTVANCLGVYLSGILQDIFSFLKLIALGLVIAVCFSKAGNVAHFSTPFWPDEFNWSSILAFGAAMRYGFFAYSGWEGATYVAEEVRQPRRNLPLSIILGISGVLLLYLAANCAYLYQLAPAQIMESKLVAVNAVKTAVGAFGGVLIALAIMMNTFGNVSAQILCKARTWYAMSRDGLFIKSLSKIHPKFKTPNRALIVQAFWASLLLMVAAFAENTYEIIIDFFSFTSSIFNVMTFAAVWILRQKYPDVMRPFKTWGYPVTLIIVLLIQLAFMIITLITALVPSLIGISLTSTGLLYYYRRDIGVWLRKLFSILRM